MTQARSRNLDVLATTGWLTDTPAAFREAVLDRCFVKRFRRAESIYRAGDAPGGLYGLIEGGVGVEVSPNDREPYMGTFARPGFWIGEGSLLTRKPRFIGIRATRDSVLAYLSIAQWDTIVRTDPEAWRWLGYLLLRNELLALSVADALMTSGAASRVASILLILSSQGMLSNAGATLDVEIGVSQDDLARMANLSRSSTGRLLHDFEAKGLIASGYRQIRVVDPVGLQKVKGMADHPAV